MVFGKVVLYPPYQFARADAAVVKAHMRSAAESIIEVGLAPKRLKERLPDGMFLPWIETGFGMSRRRLFTSYPLPECQMKSARKSSA